MAGEGGRHARTARSGRDRAEARGDDQTDQQAARKERSPDGDGARFRRLPGAAHRGRRPGDPRLRTGQAVQARDGDHRAGSSGEGGSPTRRNSRRSRTRREDDGEGANENRVTYYGYDARRI